MKASGELANGDGTLTLTADDIKMLLPEMQDLLAINDSRAGNTVHTESTMLFDRVVDGILGLSYQVNLVWDATLSHAPNIVPVMQRMKEMGYELNLRGITIDPWEAIARSTWRGLTTKRAVPIEGTLWTHKGFARSYQEYLPLMDTYEIRGIMFGDSVYSDGGKNLRSIVVDSNVSPVAQDRNEQHELIKKRAALNENATSKSELLASYDDSHPALGATEANRRGTDGRRNQEDEWNLSGELGQNPGRGAALRSALRRVDGYDGINAPENQDALFASTQRAEQLADTQDGGYSIRHIVGTERGDRTVMATTEEALMPLPGPASVCRLPPFVKPWTPPQLPPPQTAIA